jgi:hypothetical protein
LSPIFWLDDWASARGRFFQHMQSTAHRVKIVLKTKDDPFLLRNWIRHHGEIAGLQNLIIFDNGSTNAEVRAIYQEYRGYVNILSYRGFHNNLHRVEIFTQLYDALRESCDYFCVLDTDEFLVWISGEHVRKGADVQEKIARHAGKWSFPGVYLSNVLGHANKFWLSSEGAGLTQCLKWGKPLVSSRFDLSGDINHNCGLAREHFRERLIANFFILHMNRLIPEQRINSNINKLIAHKLITRPADIETILASDISCVSNQRLRAYVAEIAALRKLSMKDWNTPGPLPRGAVEFLDSGQIVFFDEYQRQTLKSFLSNPKEVADAALMDN